MKFVITPAYQGGQLTMTQRTSSLFAEEPLVLGQRLRRGQSIELTKEQFEAHKGELLRLVEADTILCLPVGEEKREPEQKLPDPAKEAERRAMEEEQAKLAALPQGYEVEKAQEEAARIAAEDQVDAKDQVAVEPTPVAEAPRSKKRRGS